MLALACRELCLLKRSACFRKRVFDGDMAIFGIPTNLVPLQSFRQIRLQAANSCKLGSFTFQRGQIGNYRSCRYGCLIDVARQDELDKVAEAFFACVHIRNITRD